MSFSKFSKVAGAIALSSLPAVFAHGTVSGFVVDGVYYPGYNANFQYMTTEPEVAAWYIPQDQGNGFVNAYTDPDIICHLAATNGKTSIPVTAGGSIELQWTAWPESHHGPMLSYLASCKDDCKTVDKTALEFFKIDEAGLIDDTTVPGIWGSDKMIANNNTWVVTIPDDIAPGGYVLRHETIALHSAGQPGNAQNYPFCVNLEVTGTGSAAPAGVLGTALYKGDEPGLVVNIYQSLTYEIPGPALYSGAIAGTQTAGASATATAPASSGAASATSAAGSSVITASAVLPSATGSLPGYGNSTTKASVCKSKTKKASSGAALPTTVASSAAQATGAASTDVEQAGAPTSAVLATSALNTQVVASSVAAASASATAPASSGSDASTVMPTGTTLGDLLAWISGFFMTHAGQDYDQSTVARRHARDLEIAAYGQ